MSDGLPSDDDGLPPKRKRRHGPKPLADDVVRKNKISVFLSDREKQSIESRAAYSGLSVAEFLRHSGLQSFPQPPRPIPEINREAWKELSKANSNLNQAMKLLNAKPDSPIDILYDALTEFRNSLIGVNDERNG